MRKRFDNEFFGECIADLAVDRGEVEASFSASDEEEEREIISDVSDDYAFTCALRMMVDGVRSGALKLEEAADVLFISPAELEGYICEQIEAEQAGDIERIKFGRRMKETEEPWGGYCLEFPWADWIYKIGSEIGERKADELGILEPTKRADIIDEAAAEYGWEIARDLLMDLMACRKVSYREVRAILEIE